MNKLHFILIGFVVILATLSACKKNQITSDPSAKLEFSADTVLFDTLFTTLGSTTQYLKIYNQNDQRINISNIELLGGSSSAYRVNVDGIPGDVFQDIEIASNDSLWVFIEVTIDPNEQNLPFVVEDELIFEINGNVQHVQLAAWGQNAHFHGGLGALSVLDCPSEVWNPDLPHVIYGIVAVDEGCSLTINSGTQVYCHKGSGLYVYKGGLEINGQLNNEVCFQGDRLEESFGEIPGQWGIEIPFEFESTFGVEEVTISRGGIWLFEVENCTINYAIIKNGTIGIQVDTVANASADALELTNTKIENMAAIGLLAQSANISGYNNLFGNAGQHSLALTIGGRYALDHCTIANYWSESNRQTPAFVLNNFYEDAEGNLQIRPLTNGTLFRNCIFWGNNANLSDFNEFAVVLEEEESQIYFFQDCAVDTEEDVSDGPHYLNMRNGLTPPFIAPADGDFHLSTSTNVWQAQSIGFPDLDLDGVSRSSNFPPEKGCYEFVD